ncbi:MAG: D-aminoacyl-tRNA deacylase [Thermoplasmata archaeon]|nr:D-aminoacyl-tRNA deacylase [Thermoplasmata archaeon]MBE3137394.1 D-aminoacyl-tRNA deacylase [Thermoplasmata archaeon]MBE3140356.1 D-aminoacyl-tRNA deacylase [Thermoplasmata archaeon]
MTVLIISSTEDPASTNIKNSLLEQTTWEEHGTFYNTPVFRHASMNNLVIVTIPDKKIRHENIDTEVFEQLHIEPKIAIFLSRHRSKMGEPTLTVHPIGNFGDAKFGGKPKTLIPAAPRMMTHLLRLIKKNLQPTDLKYQVCYEVTHHGPFLKIPTLFVEVGSTEIQWQQKEPASIIASSLLELFAKYHYEEEFPNDIPVLLGIGGGHYAPRFTEVAVTKNIAFGHMIPTYQIEGGNIDDEILEKTIQATPNIKGIYLHKKELKKSQVTQYRTWFETRGISIISSKDLPDL